MDLLNFKEIELRKDGHLLEHEVLHLRYCFELLLDDWHCEHALDGCPSFLFCLLLSSGLLGTGNPLGWHPSLSH